MIPVFLAITADATAGGRRRAAWQAVVVAAVVIATFALFGQQILVHLGISVPNLQVAEGLLLLVIALDLLRGGTERLSGAAKTNVAFVPWARHCWPGRARSWPSWSSSARPERGDQRLGIALGLLACWRCRVCPCAVLACSSGSSRAGIDLTTCISGLLLSAIAVQLVVDAVREFTCAGL